MLFYYPAKGTFTKLKKETAEEIELNEDQIKPKQTEQTDQTTPASQKGQADGNNALRDAYKFCLKLIFLCKSEKYIFF